MGMLKQAREASPQDDPTAAAPLDDAAEGEAPAPDETATPDEGSADTGAADEGGGSDWPDHLPPEEQDNFERAVTMLYDVLYKNPDTGKAVLDQLVADQEPQIKVEAAARAVVLLVQQIDEKLNLSNDIMPYFLVTVVDRLLELATKVKKVAFDEKDTMAVLSAASDGVQALFGDQGGQPPDQGAAPAQPPEAAAQAPAPDVAAPPEGAQ